MGRMADSPQDTSWLNRLLAMVQFLAQGKAGIALRSILEILEIAEQVRDRLGYHGMFEVLSYDATLEIKDATGDEATLTRRETIRFLQDNVVALHDHAWGNGELFAEYHCRPGVPVDFYEDGSKHNVLISLRETKNRGDVMDLWIQRVVRGGLATPPWWLETEIEHWTRNLKLSIIFPKERLCRHATITRRIAERTAPLGDQHFAFLRDGRQQVTWQAKHPKLHDVHTIKWDW